MLSAPFPDSSATSASRSWTLRASVSPGISGKIWALASMSGAAPKNSGKLRSGSGPHKNRDSRWRKPAKVAGREQRLFLDSCQPSLSRNFRKIVPGAGGNSRMRNCPPWTSGNCRKSKRHYRKSSEPQFGSCTNLRIENSGSEFQLPVGKLRNFRRLMQPRIT